MAINESEQPPKTEAPAEVKQPEKIPKRPGLFREVMAKVLNVGSEKYWTDVDTAIFAEIEAGEKEEQILKDAAENAKKEIFSQAEEEKIQLQEKQRLINTMKESGTIAPEIAKASIDTLARLDAMMDGAENKAETNIDAEIPIEIDTAAFEAVSDKTTAPLRTENSAGTMSADTLARLDAMMDGAENKPETSINAEIPSDLESKIAQLKIDAEDAGDEDERTFYLSEIDRLSSNLADSAAELGVAAAVAGVKETIPDKPEKINKEPLIPNERPKSTSISAFGELIMSYPKKKVIVANDMLTIRDLDENGNEGAYHMEPIAGNADAIAALKKEYESYSVEDLKKYNVDKKLIELIKTEEKPKETVPLAKPDKIFIEDGLLAMSFGKPKMNKSMEIRGGELIIRDINKDFKTGYSVEPIAGNQAAIDKFIQAFEYTSAEEMKNNNIDQSVIDLIKGEQREPLIPNERPKSTSISAFGELIMSYPNKKVIVANDMLTIRDLDENGNEGAYHMEPITGNADAIATLKREFGLASAGELKKFNVDTTLIEILKGKQGEGEAGEPKLIDDDPEFKKILQKASLDWLKTNDSKWFYKKFSGELAPNGYLLDKNGKETSWLPSQNITRGWDGVLKTAKNEFSDKYPDKFKKYEEAGDTEEDNNVPDTATNSSGPNVTLH